MEKLTRKLINALPHDVKEITLKVVDVPFDFDRHNGNPKKYAPGISYEGIRGSNGSRGFEANISGGRIICKRRFFDSSNYIEARIVASEAKTYLEYLGVKVTVNHAK